MIKQGYGIYWTRLDHASSYRQNTEINDLRKIICLRKPEVSVERISVCNVIENLAEHSIHCLLCFYSNVAIIMLP